MQTYPSEKSYTPHTHTYLQHSQIEETIQQQTVHTLETILQQNYFQYNSKFFKPAKDVAMGLLISGLIAEMFLQYFEQLIIKYHLKNK